MADTTVTARDASAASFTLKAVDNGDSTVTFYSCEQPSVTGGDSTHLHLSTGSSGDATSVKVSAGKLYGFYCANINAAPCWLKFYDTTAAPTVGSGTPVAAYIIPGSTTGAGCTKEYMRGIPFTSGIGYTIVTGITHASTVAVAANEVMLNLNYK